MPRSVSRSRRKTPWDEVDAKDLTATQAFLKETYGAHYQERHPLLIESGEYRIINDHIPAKCPACGSVSRNKRIIGPTAPGLSTRARPYLFLPDDNTPEASRAHVRWVKKSADYPYRVF